MIVALLTLANALQSTPTVPYTWKNIEIVGGGFVTGVITHPREKDLVYCRTDIGGAYRWNPKTNRWIPIQDWITRPDWNLYGVESLAIDPSDPNRVYIAAGTYTNEWGGNGAILRSNDKGVTWQRTDLPFKNGGNEDGRGIGERLAVDPSNGKVLYFGSRHNGLLQSKDYGATWKQVDSFPIKGRTNRIGIGWVQFWTAPLLRGNSSGIVPAQKVTRIKGRIYVGVAVPGPTTLYQSDDQGTTWSPTPNQPKAFIPHHAKITSDGTLVVAYSNGPGPNGVTDGAFWKLNIESGEWTEITPEKPAPGNTFGYAGVAIDARNPNVYMVSSLDRWSRHDTIWRTTDGGKTWKSLSESAVRDSSKAPYLNWARPEPEFGHWIGDVEIDPHNANRAWYVTGATIWSTDDLTNADKGEKTHWIPRAEGLEETAVIDLVSPPEGAHVISALGDIAGFAHLDLTKSPPGGMWTNPIWNTTTDVDYARMKPNLVIRVGYGNGPHGAISEDGGQTWQPLEKDPPGNHSAGSAAISSDGTTIVWIPQGGQAHWTKDRGKTWTPCQNAPEGGRVVSDKNHPNLFAIHDAQTGQVLVSDDEGKTFKNRWVAPTNKDYGKLQSSPRSPVDFWLPMHEKGLFRMRHGRPLEKVDNIEWVDQIGFGKAAPGAAYPTIFVIGRRKGVPGVYRSTDEAKSWGRINDAKTGFGTMQVIEGDPKVFGRVYVGTNGRGILVADSKTSGR